MRVLSRVCVAVAIGSLCWAHSAVAGMIPVFDYEFPASASSLSAGSDPRVSDLSSAHHNANAVNFTGTGLSSNVPVGKSGSSIDFGATSGASVLMTTAGYLLTNSAVAAAGGLTFDVWINPTDADLTGIHQLINSSTSPMLALSDGKVRFSFISDTVGISTASAIAAGTWCHVVGQFDTLGNSAVADPVPGWGYDVAGKATLYVNDAKVGSFDVTSSGLYTDILGWQISVGRASQTSDAAFHGLMYNPKVYLGLVPEPSTLGLLGAGVAGLLAFAWRKRR